MTEATHSEQLEAAFASRRLEVLVELMDEGVVWRGIPGPRLAGASDGMEDEHDADHQDDHEDRIPICRDRDEVRGTMQQFLDQGGDAEPVILMERGDSVAVEIRPRQAENAHAEVPAQLFQVMTFRGRRIALIQDFPDRESALHSLE